MLEKDIEQYLIEQAKKVLHGSALKWVCPGHAGVPDRIILASGLPVVFVEVKRPAEKLRPLQMATHLQLMALGADCRVVASKEEVDELIHGLHTAQVSKIRNQ